MPADDRAAEMDVLRRRYPRWTIWFGSSTNHWWALPPDDRDVCDFVEAETAANLIARIEVIQYAVILDNPRRQKERRRSVSLLRLDGAATPPFGRVPVAAWPGSVAK
ncbi:hypothetical protein [Actinomadura alba]|uniref:Uncharacterized protein n=1 Tax=Actinomadura alba TaxID=406431 RepID=A0ABR7LI69_9ACTN|nr:hypothetical protein [Actinomadura alba]MBC6464202.1 hypothetical protein [Actinomadura alba]